MENNTGLEIAVIGMSGRFPGASDPEAFWANLAGAVESIRGLTEEELLEAGEDAWRIKDQRYVRAAAMLEGKEYFDSAFFGYRPDEAAVMDPQMRIFHEVVWAALEDAGYGWPEGRGKVGLFVGATNNINWEVCTALRQQEGLVDPFTATQLSDVRYLATRLSYELNLGGPAVFLDTACSTSLVAVHQACRSLLLGECTMAVAGGVTVGNRGRRGYWYEEGLIHSRDGHCRAFDAQASGTVAGEGAGAVVLKPLKQALRDGDPVWGVIRGSGVNNDGSNKVGYTAPSIEGQAEAIVQAHRWARVSAETITYVEAHGTGTRLGDPIEVAALNRAFGHNGHKYCALGSVKTNIGHLDAAAGVAGLIKVLLSLHHRQLPPSLHFQQANPGIAFGQGPFYVNSTLQEWRGVEGYPLRAGVSSFGIGGTNAHVVVEEAPVQAGSSPSRRCQMLVLSARTPAALQRNKERLRAFLQGDRGLRDSGRIAPMADIAYTLQTGRQPMEYRQVVIGCDRQEWLRGLEAPAEEESGAEGGPMTVYGITERGTRRPVIFLFSGQGSQYDGMCTGLYRQEEVFRREVDRCLAIVRGQTGEDLSWLLQEAGTGKSAQVHRTRYTQPWLFITGYALARLLEHWGIRPDAMIGHSIGEYAAACLSGLFGLQDALRLVMRRAALMENTPAGGMLSVWAGQAEVSKALQGETAVWLSALNSTQLCVVSGEPEALGRWREKWEQSGYRCRELRTRHAFHSPMMKGVEEEFGQSLKTVTWGRLDIPVLSNVTGEELLEQEAATPQYWLRQLREPVQFERGLGRLLETSRAVFVEVGPGRALGGFVRTHKNYGHGHAVVSLMRGSRQQGDDQAWLLKGLGQLWANGITIDWKNYYAAEQRRKLHLPAYSFQQLPYPAIADAAKMIQTGEQGQKKRAEISSWLYSSSWKLLAPLPVASDRGQKEEAILLFCDKEGIGDAIAQCYRQLHRKVIVVRKGERFAETSPMEYTIDPASPEDHARLFGRLGDGRSTPGLILHAWGITAQDGDLSQENIPAFFYPVLEIIRKSSVQDDASDNRIVLLTNALHPVIDKTPVAAVKSLAPALLKVAAQEYPFLSTTHIDISLEEYPPGASIEMLVREIGMPAPGKIISLRHSKRWEQVYEKIGEEHLVAAPARSWKGVYLITGGLGELGCAIADGLLRDNAGVVLLGRTRLPAREEWEEALAAEQTASIIKDKIKKLQTLEMKGGQLCYISCDITDAAALAAAVGQAERQLGALTGVFHAAGITSGDSIRPIGELTRQDFELQFSAKVSGLESLHNILDGRPLEFCLLISSLSAVLGGLGFGAYAPANNYMSYYLQACREKGQGNNWMCVSFDALDLTGDARNAIGSWEIMPVLERLMRLRPLPHVIVSVSDLEKRLEKWIYKQPEKKEAGNGAETEKALSTEETLIRMWQQFFGREEITPDSNFFESGGDSLKALTMIGRLHRRFHIGISIRDFFERQTLRELSAYIDQCNHPGSRRETRYTAIPPTEARHRYPLSFAQQRLYFLHEFDRQSLMYNLPQVIRLRGKVDKDRLTGGFARLIDRHEILRTSFQLSDGSPVQIISPKVPFAATCRQATEEEAPELVRQLIRPFDLSAAPLIRLGLIDLAPEDLLLVIDMHHIVTDGVSSAVLLKEFMTLYMGGELPAVKLQYRDYTVWQQDGARQTELSRQREFWLAELNGASGKLNLPADWPRPLANRKEGGSVDFITEAGQLKLFADAEGVTLFMLLLSCYTILLSKLSNHEDIVIGTPVAGRRHPDLEQLPGMFVNTLALRNHAAAELTFREFLAKVKRNTLSCFDNQDFPYEALIDELKIERETNRNPLFDTVFAFQNFEDPGFDIPGLGVTIVPRPRFQSKFDLTLTAFEQDGALLFNFEYSGDLFRRSTIERFSIYFKAILAAVLHNPDLRLMDIGIMDDAEKRFLSENFDHRGVGYPRGKVIHQLFAEQATRTPERTAVEFEDRQMTYAELHECSNRLARRLRTAGVGAGIIVGLLTDRRLETVAGMLGILKAGGAYLPIDTDYPAERINYMLTDSAVRIVLTLRGQEDKLIPGIEALFLDDIATGDEEYEPDNINKASDVSYIIYTSGTTGNPKGVMVEHRNVVRLLFNDNFPFSFSDRDVWTMFHSHCFDFSVWEIYGALLYGGKVIVVPKMVARDPALFRRLLQEKAVTVLNQTPSAFYNLIQADGDAGGETSALRYVIFGGEALKPARLKTWFQKYPDCRLINMFGITETTVHVTYKEIGRQEIEAGISNIGRPIPTLSLAVLDRSMKPVVTGVRGELYVGGEGVSRGYLGKEELTRQKFPDDPSRPGERLYRTGDLARVLPSGEMEYLGRIDSQVQLRGFRIEPGEIENQLLKYPGTEDAIVVDRKNAQGDVYLVAYLVNQQPRDQHAVRRFLSKMLPEHMIPSFFVFIDRLPQTANGKVDRAKLPEPLPAEQGNYSAPRDERDVLLTRIWAEVLAVEAPGIDSNFFSLGGDSMIAIKLISAVNKLFNLHVGVVDLFMNQTIREFSACVAAADGSGAGYEDRIRQVRQLLEEKKIRVLPVIFPGMRDRIEDVFPTSDIQSGMIYHSLKETGIYHDQMVRVIRYPELCSDRWREALELMQKKHAILRTAFREHEGELFQVVYREAVPDVHRVDLRGLSMEEQRREISAWLAADSTRPFPLDTPGLWRFVLFNLGPNTWATCFICHHAIIDGWSDAAFHTELNSIFLALQADAGFVPAPLRSCYKDFVVAQQALAMEEAIPAFWKRELEAYKRLAFNGDTGMSRYVVLKDTISASLRDRLAAHASGWNVSLRNLFFTAFIHALDLFSYDGDLTVGMVTNNRPVTEDADKLLGCFLNTVPVRTRIPAQFNWKEQVVSVGKKLDSLKGYDHVSLVRILEWLGEPATPENPITDLLFNYVDFHIYKALEVAEGPSADLPYLPVLPPEYAGMMADLGQTLNNSPFAFTVNATGEELTFSLTYRTSFTGEGEARAFAGYFRKALESIAEEPEAIIQRSSLFMAEDVPEIMQLAGVAGGKLRNEGNVLSWLRAAVSGSPEAIAVQSGERVMTYRQLWAEAGALADFLRRERDIQAGCCVGIMLEREAFLITAVFGVLMAGAVYIPVDPATPRDRVRVIIRDAGMTTLITRRRLISAAFPEDQTVLDVGEVSAQIAGRALIENGLSVQDGDPAYCIYTSGSTGRPKGVLVEHGALTNVLLDMQDRYFSAASPSLLLKTNHSFDVSLTELFGWLIGGGTLTILPPGGESDPELLLDWIERYRINHLNFVPGLFALFVEELEQRGIGKIRSVRHVVVAGEALPAVLVKRFLALGSGIGIENKYGPTEAAVFSCVFPVTQVDEGKPVPIGKPLRNIRHYLLNHRRELQPVGVVGELYIGGAGLARGYVNSIALTSDKFVPDPFQPGQLIYRTGDLARMLPDGNVEFLGRIDQQVKIRGLRIELEEIESCLLKYPAIREAAVSAGQQNGNTYLVAAYVAGEGIEPGLLKAFLAETLPAYMIPAHYVRLEKLPRNSSGKIDRKSLPGILPGEIRPYRAPTGETAVALADIWAEILKTPLSAISADSDFFESGGHSLRAVLLINRISRIFGVQIRLKDTFLLATIEKQAEYIDNERWIKEKQGKPIEQGEEFILD